MKRNLIAFFCAVTVFAVAVVYTVSDITEQKPIYALQKHIPQKEAPITVCDGVRYVGNGFTVAKHQESAQKGETVSVTVSAESKTKIEIAVYYASGKSEASVFSEKTASPDSDAVWEWKISKNTTSKAVRIVLRSNTGYASFKISLF